MAVLVAVGGDSLDEEPRQFAPLLESLRGVGLDFGEVPVDEIRISPAGDGYYAAAQHRPATDESPHGYALCMSWGFVFIGVEEDGGILARGAPALSSCHNLAQMG